MTTSHGKFEDTYDVVCPIGQGSSSVVHCVRRRCDGQLFACKQPSSNEESRRQMNQELEIMNLLGGHENLASCRDAFVFDITESRDDAPVKQSDDLSSYLVITDMMEGSDLGCALHARGSFCEEDVRSITRQLLRAVAHMHDMGVAHRDIKLDNILLPSSLDSTDIKLSDFGLAVAGCTSPVSGLTQRCGTPLYVAPEIIKLGTPVYGTKVDLWSCGVVLFELLSGYPPFMGEGLEDLLLNISKGEPDFDDPAWEMVSRDARDLIGKLLEKDPSERWSAHEALVHPWLTTQR